MVRTLCSTTVAREACAGRTPQRSVGGPEGVSACGANHPSLHAIYCDAS